ncbi:MAG: U32 family peptidase [Verrucomicrobia bacterium]|nr:MAG: U32 family peptidase [Verrucomicrobiota bacterium]
MPELLAPAGGWDCLKAAVANGADAVFFGLPRFNARLRADNFTEEELSEVVAFCHRYGVKAYVTLNTLVFTGELDDAAEYLRLLNRSGVDALIVQDIGLVELASAIVPELPIHASTQMTLTSPEGVEVARGLGITRSVLARELSLRELKRFDPERMPLEVFVHGALCVAYSGQCLTSESLGQRSANRGECAQACRMPYELMVDGEIRDLGDRRYLLSPQDLAAVNDIPALIAAGVTSFKIEGRLKSPEYVAAVCQVYRKAIDAAMAGAFEGASSDDIYQLEMTFSRGLYSGWMHGVNHRELVHARFGKKRGPFVGRIAEITPDFVAFEAEAPLKPGDGIVFDTGADTDQEQGGRIYEIRGNRYYFRHGHLNPKRLKVGNRIWKTDDPELDKRLRQSYGGRLESRHRIPFDITLSGRVGEPLVMKSSDVQVSSIILLESARNAPLTEEKLRAQLGKTAESGFELRYLILNLEGEVILPIGEINRMRRELIGKLVIASERKRPEVWVNWRTVLKNGSPESSPSESPTAVFLPPPSLRVLCRSMEQLGAALDAGISELYADFEDIRRYKEAVALVRERGNARILLATPRIQKAAEEGFFKLIANASPDGVLIRNLGAITHFSGSPLTMVGDFSLNVANPLTARFFMMQNEAMGRGLDRVTISYDLNIAQVLDLLKAASPEWFELTIHQHMPMFHMEHCVFAAFLSEGKDHTDCGRPCDRHRVHLRDRVGMKHPLRADVGCRNTLFNSVPQTGAGYFKELRAAGLLNFRIELLEETTEQTAAILLAYQKLLSGETEGSQLWRSLRAKSQIGVTTGTLEERD